MLSQHFCGISPLSSLNVLPGLMEREEGQWVWSAPLLGLHGAGREGESDAEGTLLRGMTEKTQDSTVYFPTLLLLF